MTLTFDFPGQILTSPMTFTLDFQGQIFYSHILGMRRSIDLEWKRCELDGMFDAQWACSWATMHDKYIGQVMERCETVTVSNLSADEWTVHPGAEGCCGSLNALLNIMF